MRLRILLLALVAVIASTFSGTSSVSAQEAKGPASPAPAEPDRSCELKGSAHRSEKDEWLSCFNVDAQLSGAPELGKTAVLRVKVTADKRRSDAEVSIDLPANMTFDDTPSGMSVGKGRSRDGTQPSVPRATVKHDFAAGQSRTYTAKVKATGPGAGEIHARVNAAGDGPDVVDGAADEVFLTIGEKDKPSKFGIDTPEVIGAAARDGLAAPSAGAAPEAKAEPKRPPAPDKQRSRDEDGPAPASAGSSEPAAAAPGSSCVTGSWNYQDQTGAVRGAENTMIEAWDKDSWSGDDFLGFAWADWLGRYTICFPNDDGDPWSGGTQEVYVKFISSNSIFRMEPVLTFSAGPVNVADDTTHNFGQLFPADANFDRGLHAYDSANDAWYWTPGYPCWDPNETSSCRQLVIHWGPSSSDGTYWNGEVHLAANDPNAPITVVHEIGHNLMFDLFDGYFPPAPNCNPHSIFGASSTGCAWTEGWAEWYPAGVYNDPNYRWPNGAVQPLEMPTWGYATAGDTLEGWVAASLIDIADTADEGFWDRYSEGGLWNPGNIFALSANDGYHPSTFRQFWDRRWVLGHNVSSTGALASIYQSTIDYGFRNPLAAYVELTRPTPTHHNYSYNTDTNYWSAVAVRPPSGADYDLTLYDDYDQTQYLAGSAYGGNTIDFVAVDSTKRALTDYYPRVYRYAGSGDYQVELAQGATTLTNGTAVVGMGGNDVISIRDTYGTAGQAKHVRVVPTNAGQDPELFIMGDTADPATWARGRAYALAAASGAGAGAAEQLVFTPGASQSYGLVLTNRAGSGNYNLYVDSSAPTGSVVINGGALYTSRPNVTLTLAASDADTGIDGMQISVDGALDTEPFQAFATSKAVTLPSGDGTKNVLVRYKNRAGMISEAFSDTIRLDSRPDLITSAVSNPPASGTRGTSFTVTDTVTNSGATASVSSVSAYHLSTDTVLNAGDVKLTGVRNVPGLAPAATSSGSATVTIPNTISGGTYRLLACADSTNVVAEPSETNNCRVAATTIVVQVPDLTVTAVSNPPASAAKGSTMNITDTTRNSGTLAAAATVNRYYLSTDGVFGAGDVPMAQNRNVPALAAGASNSGTVALTVPASIASGTYRVIVCADATRLVAEGSETNNCTPSQGSVNVS